MKIYASIAGMIIFGLFFNGDTTMSQERKEVEEIVQIYSDPQMQIKELNSKIKLSRCELLLIKNQQNLELLKHYQGDIDFLTAHGISNENSTKPNLGNQ